MAEKKLKFRRSPSRIDLKRDLSAAFPWSDNGDQKKSPSISRFYDVTCDRKLRNSLIQLYFTETPPRKEQ